MVLEAATAILAGAGLVMGAANRKSIQSLRDEVCYLVTGAIRQDGHPAAQATVARLKDTRTPSVKPLNV